MSRGKWGEHRERADRVKREGEPLDRLSVVV